MSTSSAVPGGPRLQTLRTTQWLVVASLAIELVRAVAGAFGHGGSTLSVQVSGAEPGATFAVLTAVAMLVLVLLYAAVLVGMAGGMRVARVAGTVFAVVALGGIATQLPRMVEVGAVVGIVFAVLLAAVNVAWLALVWRAPVTAQLSWIRARRTGVLPG